MTSQDNQTDKPELLEPDLRLQQYRETFVEDALKGFIWLGLCILAFSFWRNFFGPPSTRSPMVVALICTTTLTTILTHLYRRRLSFRVKAAALLFALLVSGMTGLVSFGQASTGSFFAMAFFVAAILYSRATVFKLIAGVAFLICMVGYTIVAGLNPITVDLNELSKQPPTWVNMVLVLAVAAGAIAAAQSSFTRSVYQLLEDLRRQQIEIAAQRDQIQHLATHDTLTGLPILRLAADRSAMAIGNAKRNGHKIAFMFIDLDGFKKVNDNHGHHAGDILLKETASRLRSTLRSSDTVARIGGDEFMIILTEVSDRGHVAQVAEKIVRIISEPICHGESTLTVGGSIGISMYPDHAEDLDALLKAADEAMYSIKAAGKNGYAFAKPINCVNGELSIKKQAGPARL